jgi:ABC-type phosphonate transport system ATPase subunit
MIPEFCICAAIRMPDGEVIYGHRHNHCFDVVRSSGVDRNAIINAEQGFVTSSGRFVGRKEAMAIQEASGRASHYGKDGKYLGDVLFSEDLY